MYMHSSGISTQRFSYSTLVLFLTQEQEMEKQQLLSEQARLADRGAAEMVLLYISASRGKSWSAYTMHIQLTLVISKSN